LLKIKEQIKNNPSLRRRTKFQIFNQSNELNSSKCHTICKMHFSSFLFMYSYSSQLHKYKQKLHTAYLTTWHNSIIGCKLRTD